jgi:hypothetical protein
MHQLPGLLQRRKESSAAAKAGAQSASTPVPWPVRPNHSFNRTRYGKRRKPGLRHMVHHLRPGLRRLPPRAG